VKREFHARFPLALQQDGTLPAAISFLAGRTSDPPEDWRDLAAVTDDHARMEILAQARATGRKNEARLGDRGRSGGYRFWLEHRAQRFLTERRSLLRRLGLDPPRIPLDRLPSGAWVIRFDFTLREALFSKDDAPLHLLDNPMKREHVLKLPFLAPSQWKGALRAAMIARLRDEVRSRTIDEQGVLERRLQQFRLFGSEKDGAAEHLNLLQALCRLGPCPPKSSRQERWRQQLAKTLEEVEQDFLLLLQQRGWRQGDVEGFQGALHFYPTYFDRLSLEVLNPHDRVRSAGKGPIYMECVPHGSTGTFTLCHIPRFRSRPRRSEAPDRRTADLLSVALGIAEMMTQRGFGAKTSSGYGRAESAVARGELSFPDGKTIRFSSLEDLPTLLGGLNHARS
jgi:CRISPR-associated protein Cmr2